MTGRIDHIQLYISLFLFLQEKYVKEVSSDKENIVLISKADLLTQAQREKWAEYFAKQSIRVAFWSAVTEAERLEEKVRTWKCGG